LQTIAGRAAAQGGQAVLCDAQPAVIKVLELTGFDQVLDIFASCTAAMASFEAV